MEYKSKILEAARFIKSKIPFRRDTSLGLITYGDASFLKKFRTAGRLRLQNSHDSKNEFLFCSAGRKNLIVVNGRYNYFEGYSMKDIAFPVYVMKSMGVKILILVDEAALLNPLFQTGEVAMIYDHINLMADNPLIGQNDESIGVRFPDMSNPYDLSLRTRAETLFTKKKLKFRQAVCLGIRGPETETEAECRFYRDTGSDIISYSLIPENIAAVHCGLKCMAFGLISRELVADRLTEITQEEKNKNRLKAEKKFSEIIVDLVAVL